MLKVYIAGPYTKGDVAVNVMEAIRMGDTLLEYGYYPYIPHLTHFWHMMYPRPYLKWLELDSVFLAVCDAVIRLPGVSAGADMEVEKAKSLGIPVYYTLDAFICRDDPEE